MTQLIHLDGNSLTLEEVIAVARHGAQCELDENAKDAVIASRKIVDDIVREKRVVYGVTTGFGSLCNVSISPEDTVQLQENLIRTHASGFGDPLPEDAPFFVKDYYAYYKTDRGYHPRSINSNEGWNTVGTMSFINQPINRYLYEIRSAVLLVHGEKAHSYYFSKDAYAKLKGDNKRLLTIENAVHIDLYDNLEVIPFDEITRFFRKYLV